VGKDRSTITNLLRVLTLPEAVQRLVETGALSAGHARALAGLAEADAMALAHDVTTSGLSVRQLEERVRESRAPNTKAGRKRQPELTQRGVRGSAVARQIEDQLRHHLQTDVQIDLTGESKGTLRIAFYSADDLERLMELLVPSRELT
jgi:ParB family chromosome partitioning protein